MPKLTIDGYEVEVAEGASVLDAARQLGIDIPALCQRDGFETSTSCMACVVQIGDAPGFRPSCGTRVTDGMVVHSETEAVHAARRSSLELLLSDHAGDCVAPCQLADERHADLPRFLHQLADGDLDGAAATLEAAGIDLGDPETIQVHRAEKACRRGRHDQGVSIEQLIRYVAAHRSATAPVGDPPPPYREYSVRLGRMTKEEMAELLAGATAGGRVAPADPAVGLTAEQARAEAGRCLHCDCRAANSCRLRNACEKYGVNATRLKAARPDLVIDRSHPEILHEPGKCIQCGLCLQVAERSGAEIGIAFVGRGFDMRVRAPFGVPLDQALGPIGGACADVCPTAALARRDAAERGCTMAPGDAG